MLPFSHELTSHAYIGHITQGTNVSMSCIFLTAEHRDSHLKKLPSQRIQTAVDTGDIHT